MRCRALYSERRAEASPKKVYAPDSAKLGKAIKTEFVGLPTIRSKWSRDWESANNPDALVKEAKSKKSVAQVWFALLHFRSMRLRFAGPDWLVTIGGTFFIFALAVSAAFLPEIRWLHLVQSLLYVAAITLTIRRSRWGYFIGAATAGLWDMLALFASPLFAEILDHPGRPDLILQGLASVANLAVDRLRLGLSQAG